MALGTSLPARLSDPSVGKNPGDANTATVTATTASTSAINTALAGLTAGGVCFLRGGNYCIQNILQKRYGTIGDIAYPSPVTIKPYPSELPVFIGTPANVNPSIFFQNCIGIRLRGVEISSGDGAAVKYDACWHMEIDQCNVHNTKSNGCEATANTGNSVGTYAYNIQIWNSKFHDIGDSTSSTNADHGIYIGSHGNQTVAPAGCDIIVVANNIFYDAPAGYNIQIGGNAHHYYVVNNTVDVNTTSNINAGLIVLWREGVVDPTRYGWVVNNLFTNSSHWGVQGSGSGNPTDGHVRSNGFYNNTSGNYANSGSTYTVESTAFANNDPLYVDRAAKNFHLKSIAGGYGSNSPAIGVGEAAYCPTTDYDGNARPGTPSLGAFDVTAGTPQIVPAGITATSNVTGPSIRRLRPITAALTATSAVAAGVDKSGGTLRPLTAAITASSSIVARLMIPIRLAAFTATSFLQTPIAISQVAVTGSAARDSAWGGSGANTRDALRTPLRQPHGR